MLKKRFWLLLPALLPLLVKFPYMWSTWCYSPLDRWDWSFLLLAMAETALNWKQVRRLIDPPDWRGAGVALFAMAIWSYGIFKHINAAQCVGGVLFFFSILFVLGGSRLFSGMLPVMLIVLLGCPSTTYWSEYHLRISFGAFPLGGLAFKYGAAAVLSIYFLTVRRVYRLETLAFLMGTLFLFGILYSREDRALYGLAFEVDMNEPEVNGYLASAEPLTSQEKRFFFGHQARRLVYYGKDGTLIQLLAVDVTGNIHRIHPAELCLKSVNCDVLSASEKKIRLKIGYLAVQEIVAVYPNGEKILMYVWYTGPYWSSGNFVAFRRTWKAQKLWYSYQLATPVGDSHEVAEKRLDAFLRQAAFLPREREKNRKVEEDGTGD